MIVVYVNYGNKVTGKAAQFSFYMSTGKTIIQFFTSNYHQHSNFTRGIHSLTDIN